MKESPIRIEPNYLKCIGKNCKSNNSHSVKKTFQDVGFLPLCQTCRIAALRVMKIIAKANPSLTDKEIMSIYIETGYKDYFDAKKAHSITDTYSITITGIKSYTECVELHTQLTCMNNKVSIVVKNSNEEILNI